MIKGTGTDIVSIIRIKKMIDKYGDSFMEKVFTVNEITWAKTKAFPEIHLAGRWAAKEAFYKALPTDLQSHSSWKSIEIIPDKLNGKPVITILDVKLAKILELHQMKNISLSISHEREFCVAMVIIE